MRCQLNAISTYDVVGEERRLKADSSYGWLAFRGQQACGRGAAQFYRCVTGVYVAADGATGRAVALKRWLSGRLRLSRLR